jgi:hypothetical protein
MDKHDQMVKDCKVIWKHLAMSEDGKTKWEAIQVLHAQGRISQRDYLYDCPLCEIYVSGECVNCPWPKDENARGLRCTSHDSPFGLWESGGKTKKQASEVYKLVKTFE